MSAVVSEVVKERLAMVREVIAGGLLLLLSWTVYNTHELAVNQNNLQWRVEQLEKVNG